MDGIASFGMVGATFDQFLAVVQMHRMFEGAVLQYLCQP
jgi:hypothetical protein